MYLFYIISDYCYDIIKFVEHLCEEIFNEINSVKNKSMFNKRRLSKIKGRWPKAISVSPSRAAPLASRYI